MRYEGGASLTIEFDAGTDVDLRVAGRARKSRCGESEIAVRD